MTASHSAQPRRRVEFGDTHEIRVEASCECNTDRDASCSRSEEYDKEDLKSLLEVFDRADSAAAKKKSLCPRFEQSVTLNCEHSSMWQRRMSQTSEKDQGGHAGISIAHHRQRLRLPASVLANCTSHPGEISS
eukprot:TRINITY_DN17254_c0_g1_i1.p1 TRINITY_DN17254_c0_g1~~TRINITY_DN17254_c0_g1_i1.p1  ORF type:complete len:133 (-),score=22.80 TRINITY_DN17254_c0_g1_i1:206-604(-)